MRFLRQVAVAVVLGATLASGLQATVFHGPPARATSSFRQVTKAFDQILTRGHKWYDFVPRDVHAVTITWKEEPGGRYYRVSTGRRSAVQILRHAFNMERHARFDDRKEECGGIAPPTRGGVVIFHRGKHSVVRGEVWCGRFFLTVRGMGDPLVDSHQQVFHIVRQEFLRLCPHNHCQRVRQFPVAGLIP